MTMQTYIDRGGELVYQPPFVSDDVEYYGFILDADKIQLQELCDRYLNAAIGSARRFVPAGGFVLLACCNLPSLRSIAPPHSNFGRFVEREVAFWVLVIDKVKQRLFWFIPYIFVDNTYAMAMGRELYGFPKSMGTIGIPPSPEEAADFWLETLVLKKHSSLSKAAVLRPRLQLRPPVPSDRFDARRSRRPSSSLAAHRSHCPRGGYRNAARSAEKAGRVPMTTVRQLRGRQAWRPQP